MPRLYRGVTHRFGAAFFEDASRTVPLTPADPSQYPAYEIRSPSNVLVQSGVGVASSGPGFWQTQPWSVPQDAELSTPERGVSQTLADNNVPDGTARFWRVDWVLNDSSGRNHQWTELFEVLPLPATVEEDRAQIIAIPVGLVQRITHRSNEAYESITLSIAKSTDVNNFVHDISAVQNVDLGDPIDTAAINRQKDGETFVYWFQIPASTVDAEKQLQAIWTTKKTSDFEFDFYHDQIYSFDKRWLNYMKPLRMVVDKLQKAADTYQAYDNSELLEYLQRGLQSLSAWHPANVNWTISTFPGKMMDPYLLVASAIWALNSQFLLEGELQANFSGQTVTLDYDHTGAIDGMLQKMQEFMNGGGNGNGFTVVKEAWYRRNTAVGVVGVRPTRYTGPGTFVFRTNSGSFTDLTINVLSGLGLL